MEQEEKPNNRIIVPFTEQELQELANGEELTFLYATKGGEEVELILRLETPEDYELND